MAGNVFNFQKRLLRRLDTRAYDDDSISVEGDEQGNHRFTFNIAKQLDDFKKQTEKQFNIKGSEKKPRMSSVKSNRKPTITIERSKI